MTKYGQAVPCQIVPRRPGDMLLYFGDPTVAENLLGWRAKRGLREIPHEVAQELRGGT